MGDWTDLLPRAGQGSGIPEAILAQQQGQAQIGVQNAQTQVLGAQLQDLKTKAASEQQYQYDVAQYLKNPTPEATMAMFDKYPDQAKALSQGYAVKDEAARNSDIGYFGSLYSALDKGNTQLALSALKARRDADQRAGLDVTLDNDWITALERGDAGAAETIKGSVLANLAGAAGRDKFAENYGAVGGSKVLKSANAGDWVYDQNGKIVFKVPQTDQYKSVGPNESLVKIPGQGGAPGASGGAYTGGWTPRARNGGDNPDNVVDNKISGMATALGVGPDDSLAGKSPMEIAKALTLSEGGAGSLADRNNNPGNLTDPKTGQFRKFPTKEAGLAAAAAQVARNLKRGQTTIRSMVEGVPTGSAPQSGGPSVVIAGQPKPGYRMLSPEENTQNGLDPNVRYQMGPDGQITALGGQSKAQLKTIPPNIKTKWIDNRNSIRNIDKAVTEINKYPNAIGFGTGGFGLYDPNRTDPQGTNARSAISNIGSLVLHERSGAAVTIAEMPRLVPFIPQITDSADTARKKLTRLRAEIAGINDDLEAEFGEDQGYRPFAGAAPKAAPSAPASGGWGKAQRVQ